MKLLLRRRFWVVLAAFAVLAATPATPISEAQRAFTQGDYGRARSLWLGLARSGEAEAAFRLGLLADAGQGEPQDAALAFRWFLQAARSGMAQAEFNVAVMKDSGRGTAHDPAGAAAWYGRAAAHGNRRAEYDLGLLYKSGDGVPHNQAAARAWFGQAASNGVPAAATKLESLSRAPSEARLARSATLRQVAPVTPVGRVMTDPDGAAAFVWNAPAQAVPVHFFLQVVADDGGTPREIHAAYTDLTAVLVRLGGAAGEFSWRVFTVSPRSRSYVATGWTQLRTGHGN